MGLELKNTDYHHEVNRRDEQLNCLMSITEAINNNASIKTLFKKYCEALELQFSSSDVTLCVNAVKGWEVFSTDKSRKLKDYQQYFKQFTSGNRETYYSLEKDIIIPVFHKEQLIALSHCENVSIGNEDLLKFLKTLTNFIAIAIENKRLFKEKIERENYKTQLSLARQIQLSLMPQKLPDTRELEFETIYIPHNEISGDYFDFFHIQESKMSIFCIADVAGKGIPAAILMANLQASLRRLSINFTDIESLVRGLNEAVFQTTQGERLVTVFLGVYDVIANELKYINAGHNYPIMQTARQGIRFLKEGTIPLGVMEELPKVSIGREIIDSETVILSYTDGLEELRNADGQMMGYNTIMTNLEKLPFGNIDMIRDKIKQFIEKFKENEPILDDITVLLCKIKPDGIT
ncbi:PP2C family protein-serine/threonine phosphatase [Membranihabitans maritimus]|uniref:PP2C family protein-serine/threonine phosphatase n=1 Tax=Membranihabitans maritimus TaxID=2904244 RepID=UPI001F363DA2|nr:PP2C family protein-serine/threonine phosphatase [Membranihabitans maritimus]